jgi:hypothetical protein
VKYFIIPFLATLLFGCVSYDRKKEVFKTDNDYTEFWRQPSPDSSMLLISYGIDLGAFGYGHAGTAILKLIDTTKNLRLFTLPNNFGRVKWLDNKTILAQFDTIPFIRDGKSSTFNDTIINRITVKVSAYDFIEPDSKLIIEHREKSPNGQYELVAYRYTNDIHNLNFIHVSIITTGEQIPKYGNYLIGDIHSDYVLNGTWDKDNNIIFYSNKQYADMIQYYLVHNRSNIPYKIIVDDTKYGSKYLWTDPSSR